jgi:rhodanese-related sulfurtransferase
MRGVKALLLGLALFLLSLGVCFAEAWKEDLLKRCDELHELAKQGKEMPTSLDGIPAISGDKAYQLWKAKKAIFLDNRVKSQYDTERIPGAVWFFTDDLIAKGPQMAESLDKKKEYVVYCNGVKCWRSPAAALLLHSLGFKVYWYREGLPDWKKRGYPTE